MDHPGIESVILSVSWHMMALENQRRQGYGRTVSDRRDVLEQIVEEN